MDYQVKSTPAFDRSAKILAKKYRSLHSELADLIASLKTDPEQGTPIGHNCYKIRLAIRSKGRGKSAGGRIITHVHISRSTVYLLTIYDKSERATITDNEVRELLADI